MLQVSKQTEQESKSQGVKLQSQFFYKKDWLYAEALKDQTEVVTHLERSLKKKIYCLAGEHKAVYSLGKSVSSAFQNEFEGTPIVKTDRGGKIMYHGPGQLTLYYIFDVNTLFEGPRGYTAFLLDHLKSYFYETHNIGLCCKNYGLWHKDKKVIFMGLKFKRGLVYHGVSINFDADLKPFQKLTPCEVGPNEVGNLGIKIDLEQEAQKIFKSFLSAIDKFEA